MTNKVLEFIANETNGKGYQPFRYCADDEIRIPTQADALKFVYRRLTVYWKVGAKKMSKSGIAILPIMETVPSGLGLFRFR